MSGMTDQQMRCTRCGKRLSRKTARLINGKTLCSSCMFSPPNPEEM
jgi:formylmethanofuran dehydrogenase subunit E